MSYLQHGGEQKQQIHSALRQATCYTEWLRHQQQQQQNRNQHFSDEAKTYPDKKKLKTTEDDDDDDDEEEEECIFIIYIQNVKNKTIVSNFIMLTTYIICA